MYIIELHHNQKIINLEFNKNEIKFNMLYTDGEYFIYMNDYDNIDDLLNFDMYSEYIKKKLIILL